MRRNRKEKDYYLKGVPIDNPAKFVRTFNPRTHVIEQKLRKFVKEQQEEIPQIKLPRRYLGENEFGDVGSGGKPVKNETPPDSEREPVTLKTDKSTDLDMHRVRETKLLLDERRRFFDGLPKKSSGGRVNADTGFPYGRVDDDRSSTISSNKSVYSMSMDEIDKVSIAATMGSSVAKFPVRRRGGRKRDDHTFNEEGSDVESTRTVSSAGYRDGDELSILYSSEDEGLSGIKRTGMERRNKPHQRRRRNVPLQYSEEAETKGNWGATPRSSAFSRVALNGDVEDEDEMSSGLENALKAKGDLQSVLESFERDEALEKRRKSAMKDLTKGSLLHSRARDAEEVPFDLEKLVKIRKKLQHKAPPPPPPPPLPPAPRKKHMKVLESGPIGDSELVFGLSSGRSGGSSHTVVGVPSPRGGGPEGMRVKSKYSDVKDFEKTVQERVEERKKDKLYKKRLESKVAFLKPKERRIAFTNLRPPSPEIKVLLPVVDMETSSSDSDVEKDFEKSKRKAFVRRRNAVKLRSARAAGTTTVRSKAELARLKRGPIIAGPNTAKDFSMEKVIAKKMKEELDLSMETLQARLNSLAQKATSGRIIGAQARPTLLSRGSTVPVSSVSSLVFHRSQGSFTKRNQKRFMKPNALGPRHESRTDIGSFMSIYDDQALTKFERIHNKVHRIISQDFDPNYRTYSTDPRFLDLMEALEPVVEVVEVKRRESDFHDYIRLPSAGTSFKVPRNETERILEVEFDVDQTTKALTKPSVIF